ncbi:TauD/TfdA dioxygenase family protein [Nonomuraea sp. NPDC050451]|uniref:TauD/TfdA dioxygenase family protein n=1 Tax=Nonomuraea sp. NPDC050451 TaxID=3364364 RepID=UPI0037AE7BD7
MAIPASQDPVLDGQSPPARRLRRSQEPFGELLLAGGRTDLGELPAAWLRELVTERQLVVLRGFTGATAVTQFEGFACGLGEPVSWCGNRTFSVRAQADPDDHLFETGFMPIHWDGMYMNDDDVPDLQIFQCLEAVDPTLGGATLFCHTGRVLADADPATRRLWEGLTFHYERPRAEGGAFTRDFPLVAGHPHTGLPTLRFSEPVPDGVVIINPPTTTLPRPPEGHDPDQIIEELRQAIYDPRHMYAHRWQVGDIVIADNNTLLHTREPYPSDVPRHLRRVTTRFRAAAAPE